jgi:hypothetical protein
LKKSAWMAKEEGIDWHAGRENESLGDEGLCAMDVYAFLTEFQDHLARDLTPTSRPSTSTSSVIAG